MADYYSLLAKAVSNLPKAGPEPARKAIYDRARKALVRQLRSLGPALSEADIAREEAALEAAIGKLEGQFSPAAPTPSSSAGARPSPSSPGPAAPRPSSYVPPPRPAPSAAAAPPPRRAHSDARHAARASRSAAPSGLPAAAFVRAPVRVRRAAAAVLYAVARRRPFAAGGADGFEAGAGGALFAAARRAPLRTALRSRSVAARAPAADEFVDDGYAPPVEASDLERAEAIGAADAGLRPSAPRRLDRPRRGAAAWILTARGGRRRAVDRRLRLPVAAESARPGDQGAGRDPDGGRDRRARQDRRAGRRRGGDAGAAGESPAATETPAAAATPAATPTAAASPAASAATPAPTAAATTAPNPGVAVAARAAMLVAVTSDPQKPAVSLGSVVWSTIPAAPGQPATVAVKAEADIPDLKMHAVMTLRKNTDPSLPASHTIDLRVAFADGAEIKGIKDMRVPMMRRDDPPSQDALSGVRVKISDSYFLVGLNRGDAELAHNVDLIANRGWFDFPMLLNDDRIAKLTFEKGADGERIVNDALAAWK